MISSYFKTARRVITRNRAFSFINIIGLAASMSVGLLFITILADVLRYDKFHENRDRIIRVTTTDRDGEREVALATSSPDLGREIRDNVAEAEVVTTVGHGFGGDFKLNDNTHTLRGYSAEPSFFEVFSFPLLQGDPKTALVKPNSIVVTESTALRVFGTTDALGKSLTKENEVFVITGVMKEVSKFSHMRFEALGATVHSDEDNWGNIWSNYTYVLMREGTDPLQVQDAVNRIAGKRNTPERRMTFGVQYLTDIVFFSQRLDNQIGPSMPTRFLWLITGLSIIVLITAGFNYTNLSIARASTRMREVGIRKVIGARSSQVILQFIAESTVISLMALLFALLIFSLIRPEFLALTPNLERLFDLNLSPIHIIFFVVFAIVTGVVSGLVPAMFFSKMNAVQVLRGGGLKGSSRAIGRKALVVVQYVFALTFITSTVILYKQYSDFVNFDLGFNTSNTLNIFLRGNKPEVLESKLASMPEVRETSRAFMVTSTGNNYYTHVKGKDPNDSIRAWYNKIDEKYLDFFHFQLIAGRNLATRLDGTPEREAIVNETMLKELNTALNETLTIDGNKLTIVGVVKDFHYSTIDNKIGPFVFRQLDKPRILNVKVESQDLQATLAKIESAWKSIDDVHPLNAEFYDSQIENAYREYSSIGKVVGFLALLTVIICSLGLLGMVIFSAETRMREMSIRRIMGAEAWNVTVLLSRNFLLLLCISALIAIPLTWGFFTKVVLQNVTYHNPISSVELFSGAIVVGSIALLVLITQSLRVAKRNPLEVLRSE